MPTPPLVIPAGFAQCEFIHTQIDSRQQAICTLGVDTDVASALHQVGNAWASNMLAEMNAAFIYTEFRAIVAAGTLVIDHHASPGLGGGAGMTPQVAYLVRKNTSVPGRHGRGRMYLPGVDEPSVDQDGTVLAAKVTGLNTELTNFLGALLLLSPAVHPYILHRTGAVAPTEIDTFEAETIVATQRRRLRR